jgi:hypothetical protein
MVQLLVSGFGENVRKQWQVKTRNLSERVMEEYKLVPAWSYELVPRREAPTPPQSRKVQARTRYRGLYWGIELDTSWSQKQVHEAVLGLWKEEWEKCGRRSTELETRDEHNCLTRFMVHEGWTYVLQEKNTRGPGWLSRKDYAPSKKRVTRPDEAVLVGIQLEDGMRIERAVPAGTEETKLKRIMWQELGPPEGTHYIHIRNARDEESDTFEIGRQWTYILRKRPRRQTAKKGTEEGNANVKLKLNWKCWEKHVTARREWDEERATIEFKKLAGVAQSYPCKLQVYNQKGERVPFEINTTFSYLLVAR